MIVSQNVLRGKWEAIGTEYPISSRANRRYCIASSRTIPF
jgi:hypothetical protein